MMLRSIQKNGIIACNTVYLPAIVPVDYGGMFVCNVSIRLIDGSLLSRSSLELAEPADETACTEGALALLQQSVTESGLRPRCDYLDAQKTLQYRSLIGKEQPTCLVSACLAGERCRYDGGDNLHPRIQEMLLGGEALPVCPEVSGGLGVPRLPCEKRQGQIVDTAGEDCAAIFLKGAQHAWMLAHTFGIHRAILKEKSPSCGSCRIYDGSFSRTLIDGEGICTALLRKNGIEVISEEVLG